MGADQEFIKDCRHKNSKPGSDTEKESEKPPQERQSPDLMEMDRDMEGNKKSFCKFTR